MAKWYVMAKRADFNEIAAKFNITPVVARLIRNRDIVGDEAISRFLSGKAEDLYDGKLLKDMDRAVAILLQRREDRKKVRILGDYDVDGACASFILKKGLQGAGIEADVVIPDRVKDGYGINGKLIEEACEDKIDTLITCDNGIAAAKQIEYAKDLKMTVIITDHHEVPFEKVNDSRVYLLPQADAVVDPKQEDCCYPFKGICGAVTALKVINCLYEAIEQETALRQAHTERENIKRELLGFAALATVCDVMELKDENRIIVKEGLKILESSGNRGLEALLEVNGLKQQKLSVYHLGFVLGPCINATGRLDTARRALELFDCSESGKCQERAKELKALNDSRKLLTAKCVEEAIRQIEEEQMTDKVLVLYLPQCHESIAGIVAGRIRDKYYKPAFVLTRGESDDNSEEKFLVKGSGRSIDAYSMYEELTELKELFIKFGGHRLAAGLSMKEENVPLFREKINENCSLTQDDLEKKVSIDIPMPMEYMDFQTLQDISLLEPFGNGNPKPLFAQKMVRIFSIQIMGRDKNVIKMKTFSEEKKPIEIVGFCDVENFKSFVRERLGEPENEEIFSGQNLKSKELFINIAYYAQINEYMGNRSIQIVMQYYS